MSIITLPGSTNGDGEIDASCSVGTLRRKVVVAARAGTSESAYSSAFTVGQALPGNLITGDVNSGRTLDYTGAANECVAQGGRLPTVNELQGMTGSWSSSGLPYDVYRASDGSEGFRDVVYMPSGIPSLGTDTDTIFGVVCHAP